MEEKDSKTRDTTPNECIPSPSLAPSLSSSAKGYWRWYYEKHSFILDWLTVIGISTGIAAVVVESIVLTINFLAKNWSNPAIANTTMLILISVAFSLGAYLCLASYNKYKKERQ